MRTRLPLAATMDVRIASLGLDDPDHAGPTLTAPLAVNSNHLGTAFGGSIATLAILTGWAAVHYRLVAEARPARIVVQRTAMEYLDPAQSDLTATGAPIEAGSWRRLVRGLERHGRGRTVVTVTVSAGDATVAVFEGTYVALAE